MPDAKSKPSDRPPVRGFLAIGLWLLGRKGANRIEGYLQGKGESGRKDGTGGLSATSVSRLHKTLSKPFRDAYRRNEIATNPMLNVDSGAWRRFPTDPSDKVWSDEVVAAFLEATSDFPPPSLSPDG